MIGVVAGHLGIALILSLGVITVRSAPPSAAMVLVQVAAPAAAAPLSAPELRLAEIATDVKSPDIELTEPDAASPSATEVTGCDLTDIVSADLRGSAAVRTALAEMPSGSRSVANAMMLWNGSWATSSTAAGQAALVVIQKVVAESVRLAPVECRAAVVVGPRLIFVPDGDGTTILALGSGSWSWGQLLRTTPPNSKA